MQKLQIKITKKKTFVKTKIKLTQHKIQKIGHRKCNIKQDTVEK